MEYSFVVSSKWTTDFDYITCHKKAQRSMSRSPNVVRHAICRSDRRRELAGIDRRSYLI
jgi:hypothetical protein